jgi:hypothetical protein
MSILSLNIFVILFFLGRGYVDFNEIIHWQEEGLFFHSKIKYYHFFFSGILFIKTVVLFSNKMTFSNYIVYLSLFDFFLLFLLNSILDPNSYTFDKDYMPSYDGTGGLFSIFLIIFILNQIIFIALIIRKKQKDKTADWQDNILDS